MIIVSQDKEHIINFDNIKEVRTGCNGSIKVDIFEDYELTLGYYKTEERAKEVLQEIVEEYETNIITVPIYEMPKD